MTARIVYGEDQALLRDETRRWLAERAPIETVRALLDDPRGDDPAVWKELGELGWLGLVVPEAYGGAGLGAVDLAVVCDEAGRVLLPTPLLSQVLAAHTIALAGSEAQRDAWLPRLAAGELRATLAHVEPDGGWRLSDTTLRCESGAVTGSKHFVCAAPTAELFCVPVRVDGQVRMALLTAETDGVRVEPEQTLDSTRRQGRLQLDAARVAPDGLLERPVPDFEIALQTFAATALAAECVGGADRALDMTAEYAATREQFGKAIGSFQAIKHPLVNVLIQAEQARSLVYAAASAIDAQHEDAALLAHMAKAQACEAYGFATSRAIQFHGGYGFTEECDAHLYLRRAQASRPVFGDPAWHRAAVANALLGPA
jgi:alkylation response protein AidB-like acyl-CoA dehydrogenase